MPEEAPTRAGTLHWAAGGAWPHERCEACDVTVHSCLTVNLVDDALAWCTSNAFKCGTGDWVEGVAVDSVVVECTLPGVVAVWVLETIGSVICLSI